MAQALAYLVWFVLVKVRNISIAITCKVNANIPKISMKPHLKAVDRLSTTQNLPKMIIDMAIGNHMIYPL